MGGADAHAGPALWSRAARGVGVLAPPLCACAEPGPFGIGQEERLSLGGSVGGARMAGAPQTALHPAVNSIITGHRVGAPLK